MDSDARQEAVAEVAGPETAEDQVEKELPPDLCEDVDCDDEQFCTADSCDPETGACVHAAAQVGEDCDDGDVCTLDETCQADGSCGGGEALDCATDNPCRAASCDPEEGCSWEPVEGACEDEDPCTDTSCEGGECVVVDELCDCRETGDCAAMEDDDACNGTLVCDTSQAPYTCVADPDTVVLCDDAGDTSCAAMQCEAATGLCVITAINEAGACDDGDACTVSDACTEGTCLGEARDCPTPNSCHEATCDSQTGCGYVPLNGTSCDDGNDCTLSDACVQGVCVGGNPICQCEQDLDCVPHEDGNLCNGTLRCDLLTFPYGCVLDTTSIVSCDPAPVADCGFRQCDPLTGLCDLLAINETGACDDGDICTLDDHCAQTLCVGTEDLCDDDQDCTLDSCVAETGCTHAPTSGACDDGDPCTSGDSCGAAGTCAGSPYACEDSLDCTSLSCDGEGGCVQQVVGAFCVIDETCVPANSVAPGDDCRACLPSSDPLAYSLLPQGTACDDNEDCSLSDVCSATGLCGGTSYACDDGLPCTTEACDGQGGCAVSTADGWCFVDGLCVLDGKIGGQDGCLVCDADAAPDAWSRAQDG